MLAAVPHAQGLPAPHVDSRPFRIDEVDLEGSDEGAALVEARAAGPCHSDRSAAVGTNGREPPVGRLTCGPIRFDALNENCDLPERGDVSRQRLLPHGRLAA